MTELETESHKLLKSMGCENFPKDLVGSARVIVDIVIQNPFPSTLDEVSNLLKTQYPLLYEDYMTKDNGSYI